MSEQVTLAAISDLMDQKLRDLKEDVTDKMKEDLKEFRLELMDTVMKRVDLLEQKHEKLEERVTDAVKQIQNTAKTAKDDLTTGLQYLRAVSYTHLRAHE